MPPGSELRREGSRKREGADGVQTHAAFSAPFPVPPTTSTSYPHGQDPFHKVCQGQEWQRGSEDHLGYNLLLGAAGPSSTQPWDPAHTFCRKVSLIFSISLETKTLGLLCRHSGPSINFPAEAHVCKVYCPSQKTSRFDCVPASGPVTIRPFEARSAVFMPILHVGASLLRGLCRSIQPHGLPKRRAGVLAPPPLLLPRPPPGPPALQKFLFFCLSCFKLNLVSIFFIYDSSPLFSLDFYYINTNIFLL